MLLTTSSCRVEENHSAEHSRTRHCWLSSTCGRATSTPRTAGADPFTVRSTTRDDVEHEEKKFAQKFLLRPSIVLRALDARCLPEDQMPAPSKTESTSKSGSRLKCVT